jgi:hypothetical protein
MSRCWFICSWSVCSWFIGGMFPCWFACRWWVGWFMSPIWFASSGVLPCWSWSCWLVGGPCGLTSGGLPGWFAGSCSPCGFASSGSGPSRFAGCSGFPGWFAGGSGPCRLASSGSSPCRLVSGCLPSRFKRQIRKVKLCWQQDLKGRLNWFGGSTFDKNIQFAASVSVY